MRGSLMSGRSVNPITIPNACSRPSAIAFGPSGSGLSCFDFRKFAASARLRVFECQRMNPLSIFFEIARLRAIR